jgi:exosome complex component RRP4
MVAKRLGRKIGSGVFEESGRIFAKVLGIPRIGRNEVSVIPLSGVYLPQVGDRVVGKITKVEISGWLVDINSPYIAFLPLGDAVKGHVDISKTDISKFYDINDLIFCKISKVAKDKTIRVTMIDMYAKKLVGGEIMKVSPVKVPRIIGRGGSMINLITSRTGCELIVGQNGVIWIRGKKKDKVTEVIRTIEKESHVYGLTSKVAKLLGE